MNAKLPSGALKPKIIALDLDDTLLKDDLSISDYTVSVLQGAAEQAYITLCSGRSDDAMLPYVRRMDVAGTQQGRYIITQNGTSILDLHTRQTIYTRLVDTEVLIHVHRMAKKYKLPTQVYDSSTIYVPADNDWVNIDIRLSGLKKQIVPNFEEFLAKGHQKAVIPGDPAVLATIQAQLQDEIGAQCVIFTSKPYFLEILPKDSGKGEALLWLAGQLDIPVEQVMAFGDGMNDESMIRLAKISVAMKNGSDYIQNIATYITEFSNEEDGVARFLDKFVL